MLSLEGSLEFLDQFILSFGQVGGFGEVVF